MLHTQTPSTLLVDRVNDFDSLLSGVYDGSEDAIHDARVALRRIREALALVREQYDEHALAAIEAQVSKAARALGRVRDADSGQQLIQDVERRFPFAAATLGRLRSAYLDQQYKSRRKAIKKLEALELHRLPRLIERAAHHTPGRLSGSWKGSLLRHVALRADELRASIEHASGVYFSKRAHSTRMAIKQLRYTLELAATLGVALAPRGIRLLKKAQEALGAAHDRDVLLDELETLRRRESGAIDPIEVDALSRFLRAETLALHQRYVERRQELLSLCRLCCSSPRRGITAARVAMVAGIGIPSLLLLSRNSTSVRTG